MQRFHSKTHKTRVALSATYRSSPQHTPSSMYMYSFLVMSRTQCVWSACGSWSETERPATSLPELRKCKERNSKKHQVSETSWSETERPSTSMPELRKCWKSKTSHLTQHNRTSHITTHQNIAKHDTASDNRWHDKTQNTTQQIQSNTTQWSEWVLPFAHAVFLCYATASVRVIWLQYEKACKIMTTDPRIVLQESMRHTCSSFLFT